MEYRSSEIKAGIFIFISLLLLVGFLVVIVGLDAWAEKDLYRARFKYVGGIEKGSVVRYSGIEIGRVVDIGLSGDGDPRAELTLEVKKGTPIKKDSYAFLTTIGIMGAFYVEITAGSPHAERIAPGELVPSRDITAFAQMSEATSEASLQAAQLLKSLNELLNDENRQTLANTLAAINQTAMITNENLEITFQKLEHLVEQVDQMTVSLNSILAANDTVISRSLVTLEGTLAEGRLLMQNVNDALKGMENTVAENQQAILDILANMAEVSKNLEQFTETIKERPWRLIRKDAPPERNLE